MMLLMFRIERYLKCIVITVAGVEESCRNAGVGAKF